MALIRSALGQGSSFTQKLESHGKGSKAADSIWSWLSVLSRIFLTTSCCCAAFSEVYAPSEQSASGIQTQKAHTHTLTHRTGDQPAYSGFSLLIISDLAVSTKLESDTQHTAPQLRNCTTYANSTCPSQDYRNTEYQIPEYRPY